MTPAHYLGKMPRIESNRPPLFSHKGAECKNLAAAMALACLAGPLAAVEPVDRIVPDVAALAGQPTTLLPPPPSWVVGPSASLWTVEQVIAELKGATTKPPPIYYARESFVRPDYTWLVAFVKWFRKLSKPLNMRYKDELFDCDKFSRCFVAFADLLAQKGGEFRGSVDVGWAVVFNEQAFAGIEAGGMHAVVIVGTSQGLFVVEPQNGEMVPFHDYPNKNHLAAVYL